MDYFNRTTTAFYIVVNPDVPFQTSLRCLAFPDDRFVCIKHTTLLKEGEEGRVQKSYFRLLDEILSAFQRYFPQFPEVMIPAAMSDENVSFDVNKWCKYETTQMKHYCRVKQLVTKRLLNTAEQRGVNIISDVLLWHFKNGLLSH